jgi:hypothetical protein
MKKYQFTKNEQPTGMQCRKQQRAVEFHTRMWNVSVQKNWEWGGSIFDFLDDMNHQQICFLQVNDQIQVINNDAEIIGYLSEIN